MRYDAKARDMSAGGFAFFMTAALLGELLGSLGAALTDSPLAYGLAVYSGFGSENALRSSLSAFMGTSIYMAAVFILGFFPIGQPLCAAVMLLRGMGQGAVLSQLYLTARSGDLPGLMIGYILPNTLTAAALSLACNEAVTLSNVYLRHTFSDRQVLGMKDTVRLYVIRLLQLEAVCAFASVLTYASASL
ncbi:MAG: hypothetical protein IJ571_08355 [Ruminococcus sp.]|nr:hypothetical protein [Ruminococcus sp.]